MKFSRHGVESERQKTEDRGLGRGGGMGGKGVDVCKEVNKMREMRMMRMMGRYIMIICVEFHLSTPIASCLFLFLFLFQFLLLFIHCDCDCDLCWAHRYSFHRSTRLCVSHEV